MDRRGVARIRPIHTAVLAAAVMLLMALVGARWWSDLRQDLARERVGREVNSIATALESVIAHRMAVLHGLGAFLSLRWGDDELNPAFDRFASGLKAGTPGIRTMQYVVDGVIVHTWPLEGNEEAIGRSLATDPRGSIVEDYQRTLNSRSIIVSGPVELFQRGTGVVGRLAVRDRNDSVVAIAAAVIDFGVLLHESGVSRTGRPLALRLLDQTDTVLWSSGNTARLTAAVSAPVRLPDRTWLIEAEPVGGWQAEVVTGQRAYWLAALTLIALLSGLAWMLQALQRARLDTLHVMALRRAEETFEQLFQLVPDGVIVSRAGDGVVLEVNDAYCWLVQLTREQVIGKAIGELGVWTDLVEREVALDRLQRDGEVKEFPFRLRRQDGASWEAVLSARIVILDGQVCHLAVVRDVHERVRLEKRLAQGQRLEAVGRLAGGVAHDFNNLITGMRGYADLLLDDLPLDHPHRADLHEIQRASSRAADLTRQLLTFARRQVATPRLLDLNRVVRDAEPLLRKLLGRSVELDINLAPGEVPVVVDPAQFEQVLTNLATNARDAMAGGGRVLVRTAIEADSATLSVTDHGVGIPADALPHLFEPFYTTKPDGKGTGLGLATVYGIVEQSEGRIEVDSMVGIGTTMRILLPLSADRPGQEDGSSLPVPISAGTETVLVVDDEIQIRDLCSRLLGRLGYTTYTAQDGQAALAVLEAHPGIALVVSDMVMPGMGGAELAGKLRELHPGIALILMSGFSAEPDSHQVEGASFLPKPFTVGELAMAVRRALDA